MYMSQNKHEAKMILLFMYILSEWELSLQTNLTVHKQLVYKYEEIVHIYNLEILLVQRVVMLLL